MKPILFTIVAILFDYLLILIIASTVTGIMYIFNPAINVTANILVSTILVIVIDAFRARIIEEYQSARSFLKKP